MRKWALLSAMLMLFPLVLTSCSNSSSPTGEARAENLLASQIKGMWWTEYDEEGIGPFGDDLKYTHVIEILHFNEDGSGWWSRVFFNDDETYPVERFGGKSSDGGFAYTSHRDNSIKISVNEDWDSTFYPRELSAKYDNDTIVFTADGKIFKMERPLDEMAVLLEEMTTGGAMSDNYNINDKDFTRENWRRQEAIYIYDGVGRIKDDRGYDGYTLVNLPWNKKVVASNLPDRFTDDITPENGWEWVLNLCGRFQDINNNFFAVYNKYTGILRFFFYQPNNTLTGNDHVWQVSMPDNLAQFGNWGYGVPSDRKIVDKDALGQTVRGTYMDYVTPWVDYRSSDGFITPNVGWWAFDVDLSIYRKDAKMDLDQDYIRLQMRSWEKNQTSLYSAMAAGIDGGFKADLKLEQVQQKSSSTAKGVLLGLQAVAQAGSAIANFYTGNVAQGLGSIGQMFGTGTQLAGLGGGGPTNYKGSLNGTINLGLDGSIDTKGIISGAKATHNVASPTAYMSSFDLENSTMGQGVWNLKTSPVVYWDNSYMKEMAYNYEEYYAPYFFDPNSIELELNPNIFSEDKIEWLEVEAICGARKNMQPKNDKIRSAFGLGTHSNYHAPYSGKEWPDSPKELFDFLYASEDKYGMQESETLLYEGEKYNMGGYKAEWYVTMENYIRGRGANGFAIEPQYVTMWRKNGISLPFLEVNVKVRIKMTDRDDLVILSRNYLPDIKSYNAKDFEAAVKKTKPYESKMKGHTDLYDYQMKRIRQIIEVLKL